MGSRKATANAPTFSLSWCASAACGALGGQVSHASAGDRLDDIDRSLIADAKAITAHRAIEDAAENLSGGVAIAEVGQHLAALHVEFVATKCGLLVLLEFFGRLICQRERFTELELGTQQIENQFRLALRPFF